MTRRTGRWAMLAAGLVAAMVTPAFAAEEPQSATVQVTGEIMTVNGQAEVPRGLFGVHAVRLSKQVIDELGIECIREIHFSPGSGVKALGKDGQPRAPYKWLSVVIDCQGDRYHPPTVLSSKNFAEKFAEMGRSYAQKCKDANWPGYAEFWNEPYLNWASRSHGSGRNVYHPKWYEQDKAVHGGPVTIKGWDKPLDHLRWRKYWAKGEDGKIYYGVDIPEGLKVGDTFKGQSPSGWYFTNRKPQTFTVVEQWGLEDPTQVSFWSGEQNLDFYMWMYLPWAKAIKQTNPKVTVIAGWDFGLSHGGWSVFTQLTQPIIDAAPELVDGISEHHYGIDTRWVTNWYEVICGYGMAKHNRWIKGYNTECDGTLDPAVYGKAAYASVPADAKKAQDADATYVLRDILELCYHSPAKSGSRTHHHLNVNGGEGNALRLLRELRGPLVFCDSPDPELWAVASVNEGKLVVFLFNNARDGRKITLKVDAPAGTSFESGQQAWLEKGAGGIQSAKVAVTAARADLEATLLPLQARRFTFALKGTAPDKPSRTMTQHFAAEGVLHKVAGGTSVDLTVKVPAEQLKNVRKAWLKLTLEQVDGPEVSAKLNGEPVKVPADLQHTFRLPIDPASVKTVNTLQFSAPEGGGYQVDAASLEVLTAKP